MKKETVESIEILLVEDDQADVELTAELLIASKLKLNLNVVEDGVYAMDFLNKEGEYKDAPTPDLVLMDLNMPRKDGRETLAEIKSDPNLKHIPVVILTTSDSDKDIMKTYTDGANCFITKPVGLVEFQKIVHAIEGFWFSVVKLPLK